MTSKRPKKKRIQELDALRGMALLGILLVNIFVFHAPLSYYSEFYGSFNGIQSKIVDCVVNFAGGKFLLIFAFLFGYGIFLQMNSHHRDFKKYFVKRMALLFIFGALHILLLWFGDILASYSLLGLATLPLLNLSNRYVLILGIVFIAFRPLYYVGVFAFSWPMVSMGQPVELNQFITVFSEGNYLEILKLRMNEFMAFAPENLVWFIPKTFGLFLIGIYAARKALFNLIRQNNRKYFVVAAMLVLISLTWMQFKSDVINMVDLEAQPIWRPLLIGLNVVFETSLGIGYIFGFTVIFQNNQLLTTILSKAGRLALTNYIMQSFICVLVFYSYGLGYYGKLRPIDLIMMSFAIFTFNVVFSSIYLKYSNIGPLEYLWRKAIK